MNKHGYLLLVFSLVFLSILYAETAEEIKLEMQSKSCLKDISNALGVQVSPDDVYLFLRSRKIFLEHYPNTDWKPKDLDFMLLLSVDFIINTPSVLVKISKDDIINAFIESKTHTGKLMSLKLWLIKWKDEDEGLFLYPFYILEESDNVGAFDKLLAINLIMNTRHINRVPKYLKDYLKHPSYPDRTTAISALANFVVRTESSTEPETIEATRVMIGSLNDEDRKTFNGSVTWRKSHNGKIE